MADDLKSQAGELVKKVLTVGVGAFFLTEESLRNLVSEFKLPKELITGIIDSANKSKDEFLQRLSSDVMERVMTHVDPKAWMEEILRNHEIDIKVSFKPRKKSSTD